jgi:hypothetical protein
MEDNVPLPVNLPKDQIDVKENTTENKDYLPFVPEFLDSLHSFNSALLENPPQIILSSRRHNLLSLTSLCHISFCFLAVFRRVVWRYCVHRVFHVISFL